MATLVLTVNATGTADEEDRGTPLPKSTAAERKASYEAILGPRVQSAHQSLIREAGDSVMFRDLKPRWDIATDAQRVAAAAQLPPLP